MLLQSNSLSQYNKLKGIERATVVTTVPLTDAQREKFKAIVMKTTGGKVVELEEKLDSKLIGGYVLPWATGRLTGRSEVS